MTLGYWRKANQIHAWFVRNIQDGVDDCGTYPVTVARLKELRDICKSIEDTAHTLNYCGEGEMPGPLTEYCRQKLPTQEGFFFGDTEYNENYYDDIVRTIGVVNSALNFLRANFQTNPSTDELVGVLEYRSSW